MPCNGIAVASAQIQVNLGQIIENFPLEQIQTLLNSLIKSFSGEQIPYIHVQTVTVRRRGSKNTRSGLYLHIGPDFVATISDERIEVNTVPGAYNRWPRVRAMQTTLSQAMEGLNGLAAQARTLQLIQKAGYEITSQRRAPNGAIVANIEL